MAKPSKLRSFDSEKQQIEQGFLNFLSRAHFDTILAIHASPNTEQIIGSVVERV